jgi:asparagine synthase (glutamine-hydrolysing)
MCGIAGQYLFDKAARVETSLLNDMIERLRHRGPEAVGVWTEGNVGLTHARLKLLDPEHGEQPMKGGHGTVLSYVGEIYNNTELRAELTVLGYDFRSTSDTEVLLAAYDTWGEQAWTRFNGMFAFALYDARKQTLLLVRDRFGIKPLYYREMSDGIEFSSEIAGWVASDERHAIRPEGIVNFLRSSHTVNGSATMYEGIYALTPGQCLTVDHRGCTLADWSLSASDESPKIGDLPATTAKLRHLMHLAVGRQMIADAEVGVMLSGGVDSAILAGLLSQMKPERVRTYAIALEGDEADLIAAEQSAKKCYALHTSILVSPEEFFQAMDELLEIRKLPAALPNEVLIYLLSKRAANDVKVLISGEGADELFGGYDKIMTQLTRYAKAVKRKQAGDDLALKAMRMEFPDLDFSSLQSFFASSCAWFSPEQIAAVMKPEWSAVITRQLAQAQSTDGQSADSANKDSFSSMLLSAHLPQLLYRLDGAAMAASIEGRVPFLDHDLAGFAQALPTEINFRPGGAGKELLRRTFADLIGDEAAARKKRAFHASPRLLFESDAGRNRLEQMITNPRHVRFFHQDCIERLKIQNGGQQDYLGVWLLYSLCAWLNRNML